MQIKVDLVLIGFILGAVVCAKTDGVAKVICSQTGHYGVQINNANTLFTRFVDEDIVELGIIVSNAKRNLIFAQHIDQNMAVSLTRANKCDFICNIFRTSHCILCDSFLKILVARRSIVEFYNGFMQRSSWKCGQLILERAESFRYSVKIIFVFDFLQTDSILDEDISSPCAARVLIATDIAARGIDISELPLVINYDLPEVPETYVHRIGRTGRAGRDGQAIAFCSEEERPLLKDILKLTGLELDPDSGELAPAQNSRKKPAGKKPDTAQTGGQKQAEEKRAAQKQPAQSQAGQRPGRRKPQGQAPGDPKPQGQRTGGKQTPDGQQPQDKDAAARPARRRNRNRGGQKPDGQNAAAANTGRGQDGRKPGNPKPARDKRETGSPEAPRKAQTPEKKKSGMGNWLSGILRPGRK